MDEENKRKPIIIKSKTTGKIYEDGPDTTVHLWNLQQITAFLKCGSELQDLFVGHDLKTGEEKLCFVFKKEDFDLLQPLWIAHKL